ncbi:MAG TPA: hypothetical protein VFV75_14295 [Candidatus Polarisedimenticolaceae bacterium]|nr:hypothetical protein [Candidatus Polarisedimenticolaceae bacterium]
MKSRRLGWILVVAGLTAIAAVSAPAFPAGKDMVNRAKDAAAAAGSGTAARAGATAAAPAPAAKSPASGAPADPAIKAGEATVEEILKQQEQLLSGQRFSYDPAGRRDPFRSLLEEVAVKKKGPRPKGVAGMLVTELDLVGIVKDSGGADMAFVIGSDNRGYFLKSGDEVYDGSLMGIDPRAGTATFRQQVDDPRLIKPYRDVVKRLVPLEEEKANE